MALSRLPRGCKPPAAKPKTLNPKPKMPNPKSEAACCLSRPLSEITKESKRTAHLTEDRSTKRKRAFYSKATLQRPQQQGNRQAKPKQHIFQILQPLSLRPKPHRSSMQVRELSERTEAVCEGSELRIWVG